MINKKTKNLLKTLGGILFLFGISGLIYGLLPYPLIIGSISIVIGFIVITITVLSKKKK